MAEVAKVVLKGINGKLYHGVAGTTAATELKNCRGVQRKQTWTEADATHRGGGAVELMVTVLMSCELSWKMLNIDGDPDVAAIGAAFDAGTPIALKCFDKANGRGADGDFCIVDFSLGLGDKDLQEYSVTAKVTLGRELIMNNSTVAGV